MYQKRTYRLTWAIIAALKTLAHRHQIHISELVRFFLIWAIEQHEAGNLVIPTRPIAAHQVDWEESEINIPRWF